MLVNNELGTMQPVAEMAPRPARRAAAAAHLHCDAVQAAGLVPLDVRALGVDSAGAVRAQAARAQGRRRAVAAAGRAPARRCGTAAGRSAACARAPRTCPPWSASARAAAAGAAAQPTDAARVAALRDRLEAAIVAAGARGAPHGAAGHAARARTSPASLLPDLPAEPLLHALEARGVYRLRRLGLRQPAPAGPATCWRAIGVPESAAVLRFSLSRLTTDGRARRRRRPPCAPPSTRSPRWPARSASSRRCARARPAPE